MCSPPTQPPYQDGPHSPTDDPDVSPEDQYFPSTIVEVGDMNPDDYDAGYEEQYPDIEPVVDADYFQTGEYLAKGQKCYVPLTSQSPFKEQNVGIVQLSDKNVTWRVTGTALCWGAVPVIPDPVLPESMEDKWELLDEYYEPAMVIYGPDGKTLGYRISWEYLYGCLNPSETTVNDISFPRPPWMLDKEDRSFPEDNLAQDLSYYRGLTKEDITPDDESPTDEGIGG